MDHSLVLLPLLLLCSYLLRQHASMALPLNREMELKLRGEEKSFLRRPYNMIVHPSTGSCVLRKTLHDPLKLGPCAKSDAWNYTPQNFLVVRGTYFCLQAVAPGKPVKLSIICNPSDSQWKMVSNSKKTHLATKLADGSIVCLDINSNNTIISNPCKSQSSVKAHNYDSQWFKIMTGNLIVPSNEGLPSVVA